MVQIRLFASVGSFPRFCLVFAAGLLALAGNSSGSYIVADGVVGGKDAYAQGQVTSNDANRNNPAAAVGSLQGDTTYGGLNPFNPPFGPTQIVVVGGGGTLSLHLGGPVSTAGRTLGVFTNNGLVDVSADGSGQAGAPASAFSAFPHAIVSVSKDGNTYVPLDGGAPVTFSNPTNYYTDSPISNYFQPLGTEAKKADQGKPFLGTLSSFDGETYAQMMTTLQGSAGGTWLDLSGTGLDQINYVKFDVPAGATGDANRMVVDSVSGVPLPEPTGFAPLALACGALLRRRRAGTGGRP